MPFHQHVRLVPGAWDYLEKFFPRGIDRGNFHELPIEKRELALKKALNALAIENGKTERKLWLSENLANGLDFACKALKQRYLEQVQEKSDNEVPNIGFPESNQARNLRRGNAEDNALQGIVQELYFMARQTSFDRIPQHIRIGFKDIFSTPRKTLDDFVQDIENHNAFPTLKDLFEDTQTTFRNTFNL